MGYYKVDLTVLPPASVDCFSDFASDAASHPKARNIFSFILWWYMGFIKIVPLFNHVRAFSA
jgi:hypothetical protein